jgi:hypothetical protein
VRTRVVVDMISGTLAGGINCLFLAKAIVHNLSRESLHNPWFSEADIGRLLAAHHFFSPEASHMRRCQASLLMPNGHVLPKHQTPLTRWSSPAAWSATVAVGGSAPYGAGGTSRRMERG